MALSLTPYQAPAADAAAPAFRVLVFSKTLGYRHDSITNGIAAIRDLGARNNFAVDATEDSTAFFTAHPRRHPVCRQSPDRPRSGLKTLNATNRQS